MKKKEAAPIIATLLSISMAMSFPVIASAEAATDQTEFLAALKSGIEKRWEISDELGDITTKSDEELYSAYSNMVNSEYQLLKEYDGYTFGDAKFSKLAEAYIDAIKLQQESLDFYTDMIDVYNQLWSAGYYARAIVLPEFVDGYGLEIDETDLQEFRDIRTELGIATAYTGDSTDEATDTAAENESSDTVVPTEENAAETTEISAETTDTSENAYSDVNIGEEEKVQDPIEVYNDDGVKVTITKYEKTNYGTARLTMEAVNLYHKDLSFSSSGVNIIVNGTAVNAAPYGEIPSGKTGEVTLELYPDMMSGIALDDIKTIEFTLEMYTTESWSLKAKSDDIFLNVNDNIVSLRAVYTDKEHIQQVQQMLVALGYNAGGTDGVPGKLTNSAILQFEADHGLEQSTDITPELIAELEKASQN